MTSIEELSEFEHKQWSFIVDKVLNNLTPENISKWKKQIKTQYSELSEAEKDKDREWALKIIELLDKNKEG